MIVPATGVAMTEVKSVADGGGHDDTECAALDKFRNAGGEEFRRGKNLEK